MLGDRFRGVRASEWERTAALAFVVAAVSAVWSRVGSSHTHRGDLLVVVYFGVLGLGLWAQALRVRFAASAAPFTVRVAALFAGLFVLGVLLVGADLASAGRF